MPRKAEVTLSRKKILLLLGEYKQLLTTDIWQEVRPYQLLQFTQRDLARLRQLEMVSSFPAHSIAKNSELYWQLSRRGAAFISINFGNHYYRKPTLAQLEQRGQELELVRQIKKENWQVVKPTSYSSTRPLPNPTRQYEVLEYSLGLLAYQRLTQAEGREGHPNHQRQLDYQAKMYRLGLSTKSNDYVAYIGSGPQFRAMILILPPPRATERFWHSRFTLYETVAWQLPVIGVFNSDAELKMWSPLLEKVRFEAVLLPTVGERLKRAS